MLTEIIKLEDINKITKGMEIFLLSKEPNYSGLATGKFELYRRRQDGADEVWFKDYRKIAPWIPNNNSPEELYSELLQCKEIPKILLTIINPFPSDLKQLYIPNDY